MDIAHIFQSNEGVFQLQSLEEHLTETSEFLANYVKPCTNKQWGKLFSLSCDLTKYSVYQTIR